MVYKIEKQRNENVRLEAIFKQDSTPEFIRDFFIILNSSASKTNYYIVIKDFLEYKFNYIGVVSESDVRELKYIDVIKYLDSLIEMGYKASTIKVKKDQLSSFFRHLASMKITDKNIIVDIPKNKYKFKHMKNINKLPSNEMILKLKSNINLIANDFNRERNNIIVDTLLGTGLRESELCGLNVDDLHLEEEYSYVKTLKKGCYNAEEISKTLISDELARKLVNYISKRNMYFTDLPYDKNALFLNRNGLRTKEDNLKKLFKKYGDGISPHMLRSYYITHLIMKTHDEAFVQEQVGHVIGSAVTKDVYTIGTKESRDILKNL